MWKNTSMSHMILESDCAMIETLVSVPTPEEQVKSRKETD